MKRWLQLCLSLAMLAQAAQAADLELEITPPEPKWVMPPLICRNSSISLLVCVDAHAASRDAIAFSVPQQVQPEGIPTPEEEQVLLDILPFVDSGNYGAVLDRLRTSYGAELALLEAGDTDRFLQLRTPADGARRLTPPPPSPQQARARARAGPRPMEDPNSPTPRTMRPSAVPGRPVAGPAVPRTISASMLYLIGHSYFSLQQYLPAEAAFELALWGMPNHVRAHESLGMLYLRTERYADAREHLGRAVELGRNTVHVHTALGYAEQKLRHYWGAASAFQRVLVLAPDDRNAQRGLLDALTETHEHAKANALVEQLLRAEPNDRNLWLYRAQIALSADDRAAALASLETALRLGDDSVANRRTLVALHLETGNVARAADLLRGPVARGLEFRLVDQALGWLADANEWERFRELSASVDRAALGGVEQSRLLVRRASLALHDGDRRAGSAALQEALALDPSNAEALMASGELYRGDRDYGHADLMFQRASAYTPVRENALIARAGLAIDQEDFDGALTLLHGAAGANPARGDLRRNVDVLEQLALLRTQR
ncbi:MAG TPA: tetratricopeptide repeat protein [Gammaproteobacteria bacterium]|nr:tetratricopeptide repeat protein [Gammaproteobacteria bacterium]